MIQLSPSILNSFQDISNSDCPWMDATKFATQLLNKEPMSRKADAGNAVHEAAFDHALTEFPTDFVERKNSDGNSWWVDPSLIIDIRKHIPNWGTGIPEVPFLITETMLGIPGVQLSMRADYLQQVATTELKTSGQIKSEKYISSAQRFAYLVAYNQPLRFVLAQVKVMAPRGRPKHIEGAILLAHVNSYKIPPSSSDLPTLQDLVIRCLEFIRQDPRLLAHVSSKTPPALL